MIKKTWGAGSRGPNSEGSGERRTPHCRVSVLYGISREREIMKSSTLMKVYDDNLSTTFLPKKLCVDCTDSFKEFNYLFISKAASLHSDKLNTMKNFNRLVLYLYLQKVSK